MENKLEGKVWYRFFKVFAGIVVILSFFSPLFIHLNLSNSFWYVDGIMNIIVWTFIFWILKKVIVYVLYGKNLTIPTEQTNQIEIKEKKKFNIEESWSFALGLLLFFGIVGSLMNKAHIKGFLFGLGGGVIVLIFIYVMHDITRSKKL